MVIYCTIEDNLRWKLRAFGTAEVLKSHVNDCCKIRDKQMIKIPKKDELFVFKIYEKSFFMIYEDFECILVQWNNWKEDPVASYTNKYQKHIDCSHGYNKVYGDCEFGKYFKSCC